MDSATLSRHLQAIFMVNAEGECELPGADDNTPPERLEARFAARFEMGANSLETLAAEVFGDKIVRSKSKSGRSSADMLHRALGGAQGAAVLGLQEPQGLSLRTLGHEAVKHLKDTFAYGGRQGGEASSSEGPAKVKLNRKQRESAQQMIAFFRSNAALSCWGNGQLQAAANNLEAMLQQAGTPTFAGAAPVSAGPAHAWPRAAHASAADAAASYARAASVSPEVAFCAASTAPVAPDMAHFAASTASMPPDVAHFAASPAPVPLNVVPAASSSAPTSLEGAPAAASSAPTSLEGASAATSTAPVPPPAVASTPQPTEVATHRAAGPAFASANVARTSRRHSLQELQHFVDTTHVPQALWSALNAQISWRVDNHLPPVPPIDLDAAQLSPAGRSLVEKVLTLRTWIETDRDIQAVANALGVQVHVHDQNATVDFEPAGREAPLHEVHLLRGDGHYQARVVENGVDKVVDKFSRGDCFYGSVAIGCNYRRLREVVDMHQAENVVGLRQIFEQEYPGQCPRGTLDEVFHAYGDLAIQEVRQRSAAALIKITHEQPAVSDAEREEQEMVLKALADGSLQEVRDSKGTAARLAHSFHRSAPLAAFKNAIEALVHIAYMEDQFLNSGSPEETQERDRLGVEKRDLQAVLRDTRANVPEAKRSEIAEEMAALYYRPLPGELMQLIGS